MRGAEIQKPIFIFTTRNPYDYFCSLYHELSKKRMHVDFKQAALAAAATGYLAFPTPSSLSKNLTFNSFFAIDADNLILRFKRRHPNLKAYKMTFENFINPKVGEKFISKFFNPTLALSFDYSIIDEHRNERISKLDAEMNYIKNCLGYEINLNPIELTNAAQKKT